MRMYTLWKFDPCACTAARLDNEGMPVLFEREADAAAYGRRDPEVWEEELRVVPVTVGLA